MQETEHRVTKLDANRGQVRVNMEISTFRLPPVQSALAIGRRAGIGPKAMEKALAEMVPGAFTMIEVEHPLVECIIVRTSHLRRIPQDKLVQMLLRNCESWMEDTEMLHFALDLRVQTEESVAL